MASQISSLFPTMVLIMALISLSLVYQFFPVAAGEETGKGLIAKTCNQTEFPQECILALESDSESLNANITGLSKIVMKQSATKLATTLYYVDSLVKNERDYATWGFLVFCRDSYNAGFNQLQDGLKAFDQLKFRESYQSVGVVNKAVVECNNQGLEVLTQVNTDLFRITKDAMMILDLLF